MNAVAAATTKRRHSLFRWLALVPLAALPLHAWAQIQIKPLPDQKAAQVLPLGAHELIRDDIQPWLDEQMAKSMAGGDITGAVVMVVKDGNVLVSKGYGYADAAAKKPVDPATTLFRTSAVSTLFTSTAVMQLVEQHKLDLDADINRYLDFSVPPHDGKPITLRDLLTHTAGFEDVVKDQVITQPDTLMSNEEWLKRWVPTRIYPAGEVPAYSSYGAALAGYIVQRVSGQPFNEYMERHIFQPLDMRHASFRQPVPTPLAADRAGGQEVPSYWRGLFVPAPAAALSISGEDMARFMIAHLQYGRAGDAQLLEQPTVEIMHGYLRTAVPGLQGMALGFMRMDRNGQTILGHAGSTWFFHNQLLLFPQQHAGVYVAIDGKSDGTPVRQLLRAFTDRYFPPLPQIRPPTLNTALTHGTQVLGRYLPSRISQSNFRALGNLFHPTQVTMAPDGTLRTPMFDRLLGQAHWREVKPYLWLDDTTGSHLGVMMKDGQVAMLSIDDASPVLVLLPVRAAQWAHGNLDLLAGTLVVFLLAAVAWPLCALVQRLRRTMPTLPETALRWYRLSRITAILQLLFAGGWWLMLPRLDNGTSQLDMRLRLLQLVGLLAAVGILAVAMNAWHSWRTTGGWWRKIDSVILLLACLAALWFVGSQHLLSLHLNY